MPLAIDSVVHLAIRTGDLDRSLEFYRDTLGFPEMMRHFYTDGSVLCVFVRASEKQYIEIFPNGEGEVSGPNRVGLDHVCFVVPDVEQTEQTLSTLGVALTKSFDTPGGRVLFIADPDGNTIEFESRKAANAEITAADQVRDGGIPTAVHTAFVAPTTEGNKP
jgi:lactoylglutathione lyase